MPIYMWTMSIYLDNGQTILVPCWTWEIKSKNAQLWGYNYRTINDQMTGKLKFEHVIACFVEKERELSEDEVAMIDEKERLEEKIIKLDKEATI